MNNNITPEMLIRYLDNELTVQERQQVEQALTDAEVNDQLLRLQLAKQALKQYARRQQVAGIRKEMMGEAGATIRQLPQVDRRRPLRWTGRWMLLRIAAIVILLVVVAGIVQYGLLDSQRLYSAQYESFSLGTYRGDVTPSPIEHAFRQNDFPLVVQRYKEASSIASTDHFLAGQAFLSLNDAPNAVAAFEKQLALNSTLEFKPYQDDTEYYLALAHLRAGNVNKALPIFEKIHDQSSHAYHREVSGWYIFKLQMVKRKS
jgi:tetratricopeptide (TPR) repeat protein